MAVARTIPDHETASRGSVNVDATTDIAKRAIILKVHCGSIILHTDYIIRLSLPSVCYVC